MAAIRYESLLVEQALAREYAAEMEATLKAMGGLNDIKPLVRDFEKEFSSYIGVKEAVAVNSGSDALKMVLLAAGVGKNDEVIVPNLTYQAVALAVFYCGAKPVPVDAKADDLQMDPFLLQKAITKKTKAIIAAHMFGRPCDVERISKICREKNIVFIEDVCQAESSSYKGRMLGSFGDMATFSFSYYKPLSSCGGGGGMVIANNDKANHFRRWMEDWRNDGELLKLGQRFAPMSFLDLIALRVKFSHLKEIIKSRQKIKALYEKELGFVDGLTIFKDLPGTESVAQNFVICCRQRDRLIDFLATREVLVQKPYVPLHRMAAFKAIKKEKYPVSEMYAATALHLPLHSFMSHEKARHVIESCRSFFGESVVMKINPSKIRLDASTVCQLKCPSCSTTQGLIEKNLGSKFLKFEDFKRIVDSNPWIQSIELSNWGEIFLNRDLIKIAEYAHQKKIVLNALNGVNLNTIREEMLEGVVKYQFGSITCSIDGASHETYQIYRKGGDFESVMANIRKINEFKAKYQSALPKLRWQFIAFGHNEHEIPKARQMARQLDMEFYVKLSWDDFSPVKNINLVRASSKTNVVNREEYQQKYGKSYLNETICSQLWIQPQINHDGRVLGCCVNYWGDYGNAFKENLLVILNNEKMNYARAMLLGKKNERADIPCTQCHLYKEMKKKNNWLFSREKNIEALA